MLPEKTQLNYFITQTTVSSILSCKTEIWILNFIIQKSINIIECVYRCFKMSPKHYVSLNSNFTGTKRKGSTLVERQYYNLVKSFINLYRHIKVERQWNNFRLLDFIPFLRRRTRWIIRAECRKAIILGLWYIYIFFF